jgi:hypothetical protein
MPPNTNLKLNGVSGGNWTAAFSFPYLDQPLTVKNTSLLYTTMTLPWPDGLILDRKIPPQSGKSFFLQPSSFTPSEFPLIYSFVYQNGSITSRPTLAGTSWKAPRSWGQPGGANQAVLHVRAEHCGALPMTNGWDTFNDLFGIAGTNRIVLNTGDYGGSIPAPASGIPGVVAPAEDDFLIEEPGCKPVGMVIQSAPTNCAGVGGKKGP